MSSPGLQVRRASSTALEWRALDDTLRGDVPGTDGWHWSSEDFHEETYGPYLDPALYLIAEDERSGSHLGIVRV